MTIVIEKGMTEKQINEIIKQFPASDFFDNIDKKPIDMTKYFGKLNWNGDILETQRRMRDDTNYSY